MLADFCMPDQEFNNMRPYNVVDVQPARSRNNCPEGSILSGEVTEMKHSEVTARDSTAIETKDTGLASEDQFIDPALLLAYKNAKKQKKPKPVIPGTKLLKALEKMKV